jgi:hypothetical protein
MMIFELGNLSLGTWLSMEHKLVNLGHISFIVSVLERGNVGLPDYKINLNNIHGILTQGVMIPGTLFPSNFTT